MNFMACKLNLNKAVEVFLKNKIKRWLETWKSMCRNYCSLSVYFYQYVGI